MYNSFEVSDWFYTWVHENLDVTEGWDNPQYLDYMSEASGPPLRSAETGRLKRNLHRVTIPIRYDSREWMHEFWSWLYLDRPFQGAYTLLDNKRSSFLEATYLFALERDALLMKMRWG